MVNSPTVEEPDTIRHVAEIRRAFGRAVLIARRRRDWTQEQLAEASGMHASDISEIETGSRDPGLTTLRRLSTALEMPLDELMRLAGQEEEADRLRPPVNPRPKRGRPRKQRPSSGGEERPAGT